MNAIKKILQLIRPYIFKQRYFIPLHLSIILLFISAGCHHQPQPKGISINNPDSLDFILDDLVSEGDYPFLYARLENLDGEVLYEHGSINDTLVPNLQKEGDTWFRVWSMSKIITISLALDLIEDGILSMDDPVEKFIPEFANLQVAVGQDGESLAFVEWGEREPYCPVKLVPLDSVMTVSDLINHKSGFYYATSGFPCLDSLVSAQNLPTSKNSQEFIERIARIPLVQQPGTEHFYGINTTILGFVAERATGKSLKELVKERITDPMKIEGLQYGLPDGVKLPPRISGADGFLREAKDGELDIFGPDVPDYDPAHELYLGGEGMIATTDGYADFLRMLLNGGELNGYRFLEESTVIDIHTPHTQFDNPYGSNGYNLWISGDTMRTMGAGEAGLWIGGGYEGTHFWIDPKRKFVGLVMSQIFSPPGRSNKDDLFRGAIYREFWRNE